MNGSLNMCARDKILRSFCLEMDLHSLGELTVNTYHHNNIRPTSRFQRSTFRRLQHLPERTSNSVTLLILGELPVQATIDKQTLTFFSSILTDPNSKEHLLVHRQLAVKDPDSNSLVMHVARLLRQYDLPSPHHLLTNPPGRTSTRWKMQVKEAIRSYWMKELIQDVGHKITARFLSKDSLKCGTLHPLWNLIPFHLYDIRQACIKAKMLAGVYWLGADELKNKKGVSSICPFCKMETEDLQHMVLRCSDNLHIRTKYIPLIQEGFRRIYTQEAWTHCSSSDYNLLKTILDINLMVEHKCTPSHTERRFYTESRFYLESHTRKFVYLLHVHRSVRKGEMHSEGAAS